MFLSLPVKAQLGGEVLLLLRDASGLYMHWGASGGGVAGTFSYLLGALTCVNLNEFPMQPDSYSNLCGFQCNSSSELSNVAIRFPCFGDSGLI